MDAQNRLTIDGLSIAFDVTGSEALELETLAAIQSSKLTAINMTTPYPGDDFQVAVEKISQLQHIVSRYPETLKIIRNSSDIDDCRQNGRLGIIIGFQSTEMFDDSLAGIAIFHGLGARVIQMSYNGPGLFGHGCLTIGNSGLTELGGKAIEQINERGMLLDASHANQATTAQTIALSSDPIVISHTGCNAIYRHPRSNDDSDLRAMADKGGVAGMYLMPFLDGGTGELTTKMLLRHLEHALNICGEDHVGIGSDQGVRPVDDGPIYRQRLREEVQRRKEAGISAPGESADRPPFIPALNRPDRMLEIAHIMSDRGHKQTVVDKVIGGNFYRVSKEAWQ
ncbi:MAG: membrane dipeptidase [Lysobacterales bacterium]